MNLQDIFDDLTYGELSQLYMGGDESTGGIREADKPRIISHTKRGLTALYKRFRLKENEVTINLQSTVYTYRLHSDFAVSNTDSTEAVKYLDDAVDAFTDRVLKVEEVFDITDPDNILDLLLNKRNDPCSIRTPKATVLQIPEILIDKDGTEPVATTLRVVYRANHPKIDPILGQYVSFTEELELPEAFNQALLYFIASNIMNPVGMANEFHAGNSYYAKYENECMRLEADNYQIDNIGYETKFQDRGFV